VITTEGEMATFLSRVAGGAFDRDPRYAASGTLTDPIPVKLIVKLAGETSRCPTILVVIGGNRKYVEMDMTDCAMSGTEFHPGDANTGEEYITSLVLPNAAKSIRGGDFYGGSFKHFAKLKTLSAAEVKTVGSWAFFNRGLTTVPLPATPPTLGNNSAMSNIDFSIFRETSGGTSTEITVAIPNAAAITAYKNTWGVAETTTAGANTYVYGPNHKEVKIEVAVAP
jgi:hypothetical protein